jgi:CheY-like chemotaxis protein
MDGLEVARQLRNHPLTIGALIVAVTGYGRPEDVRRSRAAGCDEHLVKPVSPDALLDLVNIARGRS